MRWLTWVSAIGHLTAVVLALVDDLPTFWLYQQSNADFIMTSR